IKDKLPPLMSIVQLVRKQARKQESREQWKEVTNSYLWLFRKSRIFEQRNPVAVKSVYHLMQNFGFIRKMIKLHADMVLDSYYFEALEKEIIESLKDVDFEIRREIAFVLSKREQQLGWESETWDRLCPGNEASLEFSDEDRTRLL